MTGVRGRSVALVLAASALVGCQQQPLGMTVGGEVCTINLHATPRVVHPGDRVTLHRAAGCDKDAARQLNVRLSAERGAPRWIGSVALGPDGTVAGTVFIPEGTHHGQHVLYLGEKSKCNDTASGTGTPISVTVRVRR